MRPVYLNGKRKFGDRRPSHLQGGAGDDKLNGGLGKDTLTGGANKDTFISNNAPGLANRDLVTDFSHSDDTFQLENAVFAKLGAPGALKAAFLRIGTKALDANDYVVYNKATGVLSYDADGNGAGAALQIAVLSNKAALQANDFVVI